MYCFKAAVFQPKDADLNKRGNDCSSCCNIYVEQLEGSEENQ